MKPDLQRIEAALNQLNHDRTERIAAPPTSDALCSAAASISFSVRPNCDVAPPTSISCSSQNLSASSEESLSWASCPLPLPPLAAGRIPALPKLEIPDLTSTSSDVGVVLHMVRVLESTIMGWYSELQHILARIRAIEAEGPVINGWLESQPIDQPPNASILRHADVDELMAYVDELCRPAHPDTPKTRYILCGYNTNGQVWSRPCSPDELSSVSMAIARHQILAQLIDRQRCIEKRLGAIAMQITQLYQCSIG